jgi:hypothetical protein
VYAASTAEYVLQFERDPVTGGLEYKGAVPFQHHDPEGGVGVNRFFIRRSAGDDAMLYLDYGSHGPHLFTWFAVDGKTGELSQKGKQVPPKVGVGLLTSDQKRMYSVTGTKVTWCLFEEDGTPVEEGSAECRDIKHYGQFLLSPDGRHLYTLPDPGVSVDAYACDEKTGTPTYVASIDLKEAVLRSSGLMPFSPDGRHLYVFNGGFFDDKNPGDTSCILERDLEKGTLRLLSSGKSDPNFNGLGGPGWSRQSRFAFTADGKRGCFISLGGYYHRPTVVGTFTRDPATGALKVVTSVSARGEAGAMNSCRFAFDPVNGNLYTCGERISSFKTPGTENTGVPK